MGIMIAGISSGSGKTTLTIGLMRALADRGFDIAAFKAGPDYIDPMFHKKAIRGASYNLPAWMIEREALEHLYAKRSSGKSIAIVEGVMGYYDGHHQSSIVGSSAHLAEMLDLDVILVMDGSSMALTAAAIVEGLVSFHKPSKIKGIVFNCIRSAHHYDILKSAVETRTGIKCYGFLKPDESVSLESRHLGLVQADEDAGVETKIVNMAKLVTETVDLDELVYDFKRSVDLPSIPLYDGKVSALAKHVQDLGGICVGVAKDAAFSFYYEENLQLFNDVGIRVKTFSPLFDANLPEGIDALYLGGGYPEIFAASLEANKSMRHAIREAGEAGMPIYAECGGLMYLTQGIVNDRGKRDDMVGLFSGRAIMTDRLQRFGHVETELPNGLRIKGHEFHHSLVVDDDADLIFTVCRKGQSWKCGHLKGNVLGTYVHTHFYSNLDFASHLFRFFKWGSNAFFVDGDDL